VCGQWQSPDGKIHGFLDMRDGKIKKIDIEGASHANAIDINNSNAIGSFYIDERNLSIAQLHPDAGITALQSVANAGRPHKRPVFLLRFRQPRDC